MKEKTQEMVPDNFNPRQLDHRNTIPAMRWMIIMKSEPPKWMYYDGCEKQVAKCKYNLAMFWLKFLKTPFPDWMRYDGCEK